MTTISTYDVYLIITSKEVNKYQTMLHDLVEQNLINDEEMLTCIVDNIFEMISRKHNWQVPLQYIKILLENDQVDIHFDQDYLLRKSFQYGEEPIIRYLIVDKSMNPIILIDDKESTRKLVENNCIDTFKLILECGIDINQLKKHDIFNAAISNKNHDPNKKTKNEDLCKFFIQNGYQYDNKIFVHAVSNNMISVVRMMLEAGDVNIHHNNDEALMLSIAYQNVEMVKLLLEYGATVRPMKIRKESAQLYELLKSQNLADDIIANLLTMWEDDVWEES